MTSVLTLFGFLLASALPSGTAVHYRPGIMGRVASRHGLEWKVSGTGVVVGGKWYDGIASTPLCPSWRIGGEVRGTFYSRLTRTWTREVYIQGDVSQTYDRKGQLRRGTLIELDYWSQYSHGYTDTQGYGRGPVREVSVSCP